MASLVPGTASLGWGFDIFGKLDATSLRRALFDLSQNGSTFASGGVTYDVPANAAVDAAPTCSGTAQYFSSRSEFQSYFAEEASVSVSTFAFNGQFEEAYSHSTQSDVSYAYSLLDARTSMWTLSLVNETRDHLLASVRTDPDWANLPSEFNADTQAQFFAFFLKFGTHYTEQVLLGGRLLYYVAVDSSYTSDQTTITAKVTAEYKGLFADTSAEASADWKVADERWCSNRVVTIKALGGTTDILRGLAPEWGANYNDLYVKWVGSVASEPAVTSLKLQPISMLFSGAQAAALTQAFQAYVSNRLTAQASANFCQGIICTGAPLTPPDPPPDFDHAGLHVAVIDTEDMSTPVDRMFVFNRSADYDKDIAPVYEELYRLVSPYTGNGRYLLAVASDRLQVFAFPTNDVFQLLRSAGAGSALDSWSAERGSSAPTYDVSYAFVGQFGVGPGFGVEKVTFGYSFTGDGAIADGFILPLASKGGSVVYRLVAA